MKRAALLAALGGVLLASLALYKIRHHAPAQSLASAQPSASAALFGPVLRIARARVPVEIDAEPQDWRGPHAQTGVWKSVDGRRAPDSEAHLSWGDGKLYVLLYAADQDIRASVKTPDAPLWPEDAFRLAFTHAKDASSRVIYVSPIGTLTDEIETGRRVDTSWQSRAVVAHDLDGTPNDPRDDDEEWIIEMAIPLSSIGMRGVPGASVGLSLGRCDVPKGADRRCTAWKGRIVLR